MKHLIIFVIYLFISLLSLEIFSEPLVIDHTVVDLYDDIPQNWIDSVKKMWATVPGESHSQGYRNGLRLLDSLDSRFGVNIQSSGVPEGPTDQYLRFSAATWGDVNHATGWRYGYGEEDWFTSDTAISHTKAGITYCNTTGPLLYAMGFGWCWDMTSPGPAGTEDPVYRTRWGGRSYYLKEPIDSIVDAGAWGLDSEDVALTGNTQGISVDTYLNATQQHIDHCTANGYPTKVFFTTGPIDGSSGENAYQRYLKHEYIRDYVRNSGDGILFDYADILSWSNAGVENTQSWTDYGSTQHIFQYIHPDNMLNLDSTNTTDDLDHIGQRGALRLGKAMWYMLARIAGWDGISGIIEDPSTTAQFNLQQNHPNPFNRITAISYELPADGKVTLKIYDILGREIKTLVNGIQPAGKHSVQWNGKNSAGQDAGSGIYFYELKTSKGFDDTRKMILLD